VPIVQAPMAGSSGAAMASEVARAGGLGSVPCAVLSSDAIRREVGKIRQRTQRPINLNFLCHDIPAVDEEREAQWGSALAPYYVELGVARDRQPGGAVRAPFDAVACEIVEELRPAVVSFHFGMPDAALVERVRATRAKILASATSVDEARWLEDHGCDVVIAQGAEAGGHRAMFLTADVAAQVGTMALVPQVVDAVTLPVVAAGGIADARGVAAALMLGADGVQIGTGFLLCPEATISDVHRRALEERTETRTVLTNVFTGRPARSVVNRLITELGPMSDRAPQFPLAANGLAKLRATAEQRGSSDFTSLWSGQGAALARPLPAGQLVRTLIEETEHLLKTRQPSD
ncbi:MAG: nitronate monooxygenase, partial [Acidimicrobiaceae bacterium]|nr:nitronate monooxygenase [Acidimicrobiaceae bacterium]